VSSRVVAPCTVRGGPLGAPFHAAAKIAPPEQEEIAERALKARYGLGRTIFEATVDLMRIDMCYLEITPANASSTAHTPKRQANPQTGPSPQSS